jgi:hypothetical protein
METFMDKTLDFSFELSFTAPNKRVVQFSAAYKDEFDTNNKPIKGYNILYSESDYNSLFVAVNKTLVEEGLFIHNVNNYSMVNMGFYKVEAVFADDTRQVSPKFDVFSLKLSKREQEYAKSLLNRSMFSYFTGPGNIPVLFYNRKIAGTKCECAPEGQGSAAFNCMKCLGTGFVGGYSNPILGFVDFSAPDGVGRDNGKIITTESSSNAIRTSAGFVLLRAYDIVRELRPPNQCWVIMNTQVTRFNSRPVDIIAPIKVLESGHPIYKTNLWFPTYYPDIIPYRQISPETNKIVSFMDEYDKMASSLQIRAQDS